MARVWAVLFIVHLIIAGNGPTHRQMECRRTRHSIPIGWLENTIGPVRRSSDNGILISNRLSSTPTHLNVSGGARTLRQSGYLQVISINFLSNVHCCFMKYVLLRETFIDFRTYASTNCSMCVLHMSLKDLLTYLLNYNEYLYMWYIANNSIIHVFKFYNNNSTYNWKLSLLWICRLSGR